MEERIPLAGAYDLIAADYDTQLARSPVAVAMRDELHVHMDRIFRPGDHVLDFTAGTGADALYLAERGIRITALDVSPAMIAELARKASERQLALEARILAAERLAELDACFDGAISTFAGLNTIEDLPRLARDLASHVRPGGRVLLHALNAFCFWQAVAHRLGRGGARTGEMHVGELRVRHRLWTLSTLQCEVFAPWFILRRAYALSVIAAPAIVTRWPRWAPLIFRLDRMVGRRFTESGDFIVLELVRRDIDQIPAG